MGWTWFFQSLIFLFAGAWLHWRGANRSSPSPVGDVIGKVAEFIQNRRDRKSNENKPALPRVGA